MTKTLSKLIANWCSTDLHSDTYEITVYGIELILDSVSKLLGLAVIAFFTGTIIELIAVLLVFSSLRLFAGGFHMKSSIGCFLSMVFIWAATTFSVRTAEQLKITIPPIILGALLLILFVLVFIYSPVSTRNNPITNATVLQKKKLFSIVLTYLFAVIIWFAPDTTKVMLLVPLICEIVTILPFVNYKSV